MATTGIRTAAKATPLRPSTLSRERARGPWSTGFAGEVRGWVEAVMAGPVREAVSSPTTLGSRRLPRQAAGHRTGPVASSAGRWLSTACPVDSLSAPPPVHAAEWGHDD